MNNAIEEHRASLHTMKNARVIGSLMLAQLVFGIFLNFFLLKLIFNFDAQSSQDSLHYLIGSCTLLALLLSSFNIFYGLLIPRSNTKGTDNGIILIVILACVGFMLCTLEYIKMTEYITYASSLAHQPSESITAGHELIRKTLANGRNEAHYLSIIMSSLSILLFYVITLRSSLLPKLLSSFAIFACSLQLIAVGHTLFNLEIPNLLQLPILISQAIVPIYLIAKGFSTTSIASGDSNLQPSYE